MAASSMYGKPVPQMGKESAYLDGFYSIRHLCFHQFYRQYPCLLPAVSSILLYLDAPARLDHGKSAALDYASADFAVLRCAVFG